jgi:hypothetical protein
MGVFTVIILAVIGYFILKAFNKQKEKDRDEKDQLKLELYYLKEKERKRKQREEKKANSKRPTDAEIAEYDKYLKEAVDYVYYSADASDPSNNKDFVTSCYHNVIYNRNTPPFHIDPSSRFGYGTVPRALATFVETNPGISHSVYYDASIEQHIKVEER